MSARDGIKQLAGGRWLVRVPRIDRRTNKRSNRKTTIEGTREDALQARDAIRAELGLRARLNNFARDWLERRREHLKPSVSRRYAYALRHINRELGRMYIDVMTPAAIERYIANRLRGGAAGNTVRNELRMLRTIARDSIAEGFATRNWCDRVKAPRVARYSTGKPNLLTPDQARLVLAHVPRRWLGLVVLMMTTGLRIGEATALRWDDIRGGHAEIKCTNDRGELTDTKTLASERSVPILSRVLELLGPRRGEFVFPSRSGELHRGSPLRAVLTSACAAAGVPRITAHGLRRSYTDAARRRGADVVLKSITGHVTDEMTNHYSLVDGGEKTKLAGDVADAFGVPEVSDNRTKEPKK